MEMDNQWTRARRTSNKSPSIGEWMPNKGFMLVFNIGPSFFHLQSRNRNSKRSFNYLFHSGEKMSLVQENLDTMQPKLPVIHTNHRQTCSSKLNGKQSCLVTINIYKDNCVCELCLAKSFLFLGSLPSNLLKELVCLLHSQHCNKWSTKWVNILVAQLRVLFNCIKDGIAYEKLLACAKQCANEMRVSCNNHITLDLLEFKYSYEYFHLNIRKTSVSNSCISTKKKIHKVVPLLPFSGTGKEEIDVIDGMAIISFKTEHDMKVFTKIEQNYFSELNSRPNESCSQEENERLFSKEEKNPRIRRWRTRNLYPSASQNSKVEFKRYINRGNCGNELDEISAKIFKTTKKHSPRGCNSSITMNVPVCDGKTTEVSPKTSAKKGEEYKPFRELIENTALFCDELSAETSPNTLTRMACHLAVEESISSAARNASVSDKISAETSANLTVRTSEHLASQNPPRTTVTVGHEISSVTSSKIIPKTIMQRIAHEPVATTTLFGHRTAAETTSLNTSIRTIEHLADRESTKHAATLIHHEISEETSLRRSKRKAEHNVNQEITISAVKDCDETSTEILLNNSSRTVVEHLVDKKSIKISDVDIKIHDEIKVENSSKTSVERQVTQEPTTDSVIDCEKASAESLSNTSCRTTAEHQTDEEHTTTPAIVYDEESSKSSKTSARTTEHLASQEAISTVIDYDKVATETSSTISANVIKHLIGQESVTSAASDWVELSDELTLTSKTKYSPSQEPVSTIAPNVIVNDEKLTEGSSKTSFKRTNQSYTILRRGPEQSTRLILKRLECQVFSQEPIGNSVKNACDDRSTGTLSKTLIKTMEHQADEENMSSTDCNAMVCNERSAKISSKKNIKNEHPSYAILRQGPEQSIRLILKRIGHEADKQSTSSLAPSVKAISAVPQNQNKKKISKWKKRRKGFRGFLGEKEQWWADYRRKKISKLTLTIADNDYFRKKHEPPDVDYLSNTLMPVIHKCPDTEGFRFCSCKIFKLCMVLNIGKGRPLSNQAVSNLEQLKNINIKENSRQESNSTLRALLESPVDKSLKEENKSEIDLILKHIHYNFEPNNGKVAELKGKDNFVPKFQRVNRNFSLPNERKHKEDNIISARMAHIAASAANTRNTLTKIIVPVISGTVLQAVRNWKQKLTIDRLAQYVPEVSRNKLDVDPCIRKTINDVVDYVVLKLTPFNISYDPDDRSHPPDELSKEMVCYWEFPKITYRELCKLGFIHQKYKCRQEFCSRGCVCTALHCKKSYSYHCGKESCMFECICANSDISQQGVRINLAKKYFINDGHLPKMKSKDAVSQEIVVSLVKEKITKDEVVRMVNSRNASNSEEVVGGRIQRTRKFPSRFGNSVVFDDEVDRQTVFFTSKSMPSYFSRTSLKLQGQIIKHKLYCCTESIGVTKTLSDVFIWCDIHGKYECNCISWVYKLKENLLIWKPKAPWCNKRMSDIMPDIEIGPNVSNEIIYYNQTKKCARTYGVPIKYSLRNASEIFKAKRHREIGRSIIASTNSYIKMRSVAVKPRNSINEVGKLEVLQEDIHNGFSNKIHLEKYPKDDISLEFIDVCNIVKPTSGAGSDVMESEIEMQSDEEKLTIPSEQNRTIDHEKRIKMEVRKKPAFRTSFPDVNSPPVDASSEVNLQMNNPKKRAHSQSEVQSEDITHGSADVKFSGINDYFQKKMKIVSSLEGTKAVSKWQKGTTELKHYTYNQIKRPACNSLEVEDSSDIIIPGLKSEIQDLNQEKCNTNDIIEPNVEKFVTTVAAGNELLVMKTVYHIRCRKKQNREYYVENGELKWRDKIQPSSGCVKTSEVNYLQKQMAKIDGNSKQNDKDVLIVDLTQDLTEDISPTINNNVPKWKNIMSAGADDKASNSWTNLGSFVTAYNVPIVSKNIISAPSNDNLHKKLKNIPATFASYPQLSYMPKIMVSTADSDDVHNSIVSSDPGYIIPLSNTTTNFSNLKNILSDLANYKLPTNSNNIVSTITSDSERQFVSSMTSDYIPNFAGSSVCNDNVRDNSTNMSPIANTNIPYDTKIASSTTRLKNVLTTTLNDSVPNKPKNIMSAAVRDADTLPNTSNIMSTTTTLDVTSKSDNILSTQHALLDLKPLHQNLESKMTKFKRLSMEEIYGPDNLPKLALMCLSPGIGYLPIVQYTQDVLAIQDPRFPALFHSFKSLESANLWFNKFLKSNVVFESKDTNLEWIVVKPGILKLKQCHPFSSAILKNPAVTITKNGHLKLLPVGSVDIGSVGISVLGDVNEISLNRLAGKLTFENKRKSLSEDTVIDSYNNERSNKRKKENSCVPLTSTLSALMNSPKKNILPLILPKPASLSSSAPQCITVGSKANSPMRLRIATSGLKTCNQLNLKPFTVASSGGSTSKNEKPLIFFQSKTPHLLPGSLKTYQNSPPIMLRTGQPSALKTLPSNRAYTCQNGVWVPLISIADQPEIMQVKKTKHHL